MEVHKSINFTQNPINLKESERVTREKVNTLLTEKELHFGSKI